MTATIFKTPSALRQEWLEAATVELRTLFADKGHEVPENVRISIGWPKGGKANTIGQCWYAEGSSDKHNEIFISPVLKDTTADRRHPGARAGSRHRRQGRWPQGAV
jgi:hypothetical protein